MHLIANDRSFHAQFHDLTTFRDAVTRMMSIRDTAMKYGRELYCHRNLIAAQITNEMTMQQAVQALEMDQRRSLMQWITRNGPFWEDVRLHSPDDYLEHNGSVVTDSAIGEAAWALHHNIKRDLASASPSNWEYTPIEVLLRQDTATLSLPPIINYWSAEALEKVLSGEPVPIFNWEQLRTIAIHKFEKLVFLEGAFSHLLPCPFSSSAAERILIILGILEKFKSCFSADGKRTPEGHEIYANFFTGKKGDGGRGPLFTDSSDSEKSEFESQMTFFLPDGSGNKIFCPFHGKVQTPQLRIHFSYPIAHEEPLYIAYVGPKITKR